MIVLATLTAGMVMGQSAPVLHTADQQSATGSGFAISVVPPSNLSEGDLVIVTTQARDGGTIDQVGSNFTLIRHESGAVDKDLSITAVWYRIATDSEPVSYEFERTEGDIRDWRATSNRITGHSSGAPLGNDNGINSGTDKDFVSLKIPGITTTADDALLLSVLTVARGINADNITHPSGMTEAWTLRGDDNLPASAGSTEERETAGSTGDREYTWDAGDGASGVMFEILPLAADGSGTNTVSPTSVEAGSDGNTLTFTYTAETGGMRDGEVEITVPSGWSAPSTTGSDPGFTTSTTGTVGVSGQVITVTGVTLDGGETMDIVYGDKGSGGPGATAQETVETGTFTTRQRSTSGGTLTEISSSPEVTVEPADAAQLSFDQQPTNTTAGEGIDPAVTVWVEDKFGNLVDSDNSTEVSVSFGTDPSGGSASLSGTTTVTASSGVATFGDLSIDEANDGYTLVFDAGGVDEDAVSDEFDVTAAAGDPDETTADVSNGTAGEETQITITVRDAFGNPVTGASGNLSVSVSDGPNAGSSISSITDNGDGTYSTSYTPTSTGTDEITITLGGTDISSSPYTSTVGTSAAAAVAITTQPGQTTAGQTIEGPPTVRVTDTEGNPVEGVSVSVSEQGGTSFDSGTTNRSTDSNGEAAFNDLVIEQAGNYRLVFDAGGVEEDAASNEFDVTAASPDASETTTDVPDGRVGEETLITITVRDEFDNPVTGVEDELSLSMSGANEDVEFSGIKDRGDGSYRVSYTPTRPGTDQIRITLDGEEISGSPFTSEVDHGAVETLEIVSGDGQEQPTRSWLEDPLVVRALDLFDNPIPGETVTFAFTQTPPGAVDHELEQTNVTTSDEGRAQTTARLGSEGGVYRVRASTEGASVEFTFTAEATIPDPSFSDTVSTVVFTPDPNSFMFAEYDESLDQPQGFNFEMWLQPSSLNSNGVIAGRWDEGLGRQFRISLFGNTLLVELMDDEGELYELEIEEFFRFTETGTGNQSGLEENGTRLQDEHLEFEWTQISLVVDPSNELVQVYRNGFEIRRSQILSDLQSSADRLEVGRGLDGEIHEIRLWDRPRSRTEIQALKDLILTGSEENLVLYHTFDEESGKRTAVDRSPNRNNFILSDLVSRSISLRDATRITLDQNEEFIVRLAALDKTGGDLLAEVVELPDNGRLFQLKPDLTRGEEITQPGTVLTDPFNRSLYVPDDNFIGIDTIRYRIFDQFGNFAEPILEFEVLKVNRPPTIDPIEPIHFYQTDTLYVDLDTLVTDNLYKPEDMSWDVEILDPRYAGKEDQLEQRPVVEIDRESRRLMLTSTLLFIVDDIRMRLRVTDPEGLFGLRNFRLSVRPLDEKPGGVYELKQNYPNPYNSSTHIEFWVPVQAEVVLEVYDLLGRKVATLVDRQNLPAGVHQVDWTPDNLASGIYFYRLEALGRDESRFVKTRKLTFIK